MSSKDWGAEAKKLAAFLLKSFKEKRAVADEIVFTWLRVNNPGVTEARIKGIVESSQGVVWSHMIDREGHSVYEVAFPNEMLDVFLLSLYENELASQAVDVLVDAPAKMTEPDEPLLSPVTH